MYLFIAYLKFLLKATNQHGVHSPFVYKYVTECLYSKPQNKKDKTLNVLLKSIAYFNFKNIKTGRETVTVIKERRTLNLDKIPYDLVYFNDPKNAVLNTDVLHNKSMILINNIYKDTDSETTWETLKINKHVTVSIDLFYCGVIFIRKEQVKEHFKIRL